MPLLAHPVGQRADAPAGSGAGTARRRRRTTAARRRRTLSRIVERSCSCVTRITSSSVPSARRSQAQAGAADQRGRLLAGQRRVVGVGAEAQRALGDDRREHLVGAEAERHLRQPRAERADVGQQVRGPAAAPAGRARRSAACRGRRARRPAPADAPDVERRPVDRGQPVADVRVVLAAGGSGTRQERCAVPPRPPRGRATSRPARPGDRSPPCAGPAGPRRRPGRPRRRSTRRRRAARASRRWPGAAACARTFRAARAARRARRSLAAEREQIERGQRSGDPTPVQAWASFARSTLIAILLWFVLRPSGASDLMGRPSWSSTRPTTVSSSASIVAGFE